MKDVERHALVDFHCHVDLYPDFQAVIDECQRESIYTLAVTTTPKAWRTNHERARETKFVRAALGLHPQLVEERAAELQLWHELAPLTRYVGEVGLDAGPRFYRSLEQQKAVFGAILTRCASLGDRVLTIHSVRTVKQVLDMIEAKLPRTRGRVVMHWFTGSASEAKRAIDLGCYFSINGAMLDGSKRRDLVSALPIERLLTETDGPFTQERGRPARPVDVASTVCELAALRSMSASDMARRITTNLRALLGE